MSDKKFNVGDRAVIAGNSDLNVYGQHVFSVGTEVTIDEVLGGGLYYVSGKTTPSRFWDTYQTVSESDLSPIPEPEPEPEPVVREVGKKYRLAEDYWGIPAGTEVTAVMGDHTYDWPGVEPSRMYTTQEYVEGKVYRWDGDTLNPTTLYFAPHLLTPVEPAVQKEKTITLTEQAYRQALHKAWAKGAKAVYLEDYEQFVEENSPYLN